jgi:Carboxypeptidase regulatory-like domain
MGDRGPHLLRYLILICAFGAASFVLANPAAALQIRNGLDGVSDKSSGTGTYTLGGIVVDASTGAPIRRALVVLFAQQSQSVLTDEGGKFQFENLAQGQCGILAHKPGYAKPSGESPAMITIGADTSALVLKLEPESGIAVKVTGEDGEGVEDLPVRMLRSRVQEGRRYWETHGAGQTDEQGEFRANNLPPGKYYVSVGPSYRPLGHIEDGAQTSDLGYPRAYYPNAEELDGAAPVEVNAGRRARLELALSTVPLYRISGALVGGTPGQPCGLHLTDSSGEAMAIGVGMNAITGVFRSGEIPAGFYTLVAQCTVNAEASFTGRMPLHVDSNIANVTWLVAPTLSIPVTFRTNEGGADANEGSPTGAVVMTQKQAGASGISAWSEPETDGDNGRITVKRVEPGTYSVEIQPNSGWYVESARYGSVDLLAEDLTVPEGGTTEAIEITLRNDGARASGNVHGSGVAPASGSVLLVPSGAPRLLKVARITNGTFTINDLAPGSYHAIALDRVDDLEYTNPEALKDYLAKAQDVTLSPKQEAHVDLELLQREK